MAVEWKDNQIYDELRDIAPVAAVEKGDVAVRQDVAGFWITDLAATIKGGFIYRCRQVRVPKRTGTGEAFLAGDRVYYYPAEELASPAAVGTAGTDYYFVGWAKDDAPASASTVLVNWDGTRYDQNF